MALFRFSEGIKSTYMTFMTMSGDMQLDHWTYGDFYRAFRYYLIF